MRFPLLLSVAALAGAAAGYGWFWRPTPQAENVFAQLQSAAASDESDPERGKDPAAAASTDKAALLLAAVQQRRDPLRCAHDLYLALQQLEARDFRLLTADPAGVLALAKRFEDLPYEIQQAFGDSAIARWLEVDPEGALAWFRRMPTIFGKDEGAENLILRAIAKKRPEEALAHLLTRPPGERRNDLTRELFEVLASSDPARASQWLAALPDKASRDAAEKGVRQALAKSDPLAALDLVANIRDRSEASEIVEVAVQAATRRGAGELRAMAAKTADPRYVMMIARSLAAYDPEDAARQISELLAKSDPNAGWRAGTSGFPEICEAFTRENPRGAADWAVTLTEDIRKRALTNVARVWALNDPQAALAWLSHPSSDPVAHGGAIANRSDPAGEVYAVWLRFDETAARAWLATLPPGEERNTAEAQLIIHLADNGRATEAAEFRDIFDNEKNAGLARRVVAGMAEKDPVAAAEWAAALPEGAAQARAVAEVVRRWGAKDPRSAAAWVEQMSEGTVRDSAVTAFAETTARSDPLAAAEWVLQISDPWQRARAAEEVLSAWNGRDAAAAIAWFRTVPGLDAEIRRQILHDQHIE